MSFQMSLESSKLYTILTFRSEWRKTANLRYYSLKKKKNDTIKAELGAAQRRTGRGVLNEPFSVGCPRTTPSLHVTQKSMISADLASVGPPQMQAKVRCQSSAKHFLVEGDPEAAGCEQRAVKKLARKVRGEHGVSVVLSFGLDQVGPWCLTTIVTATINAVYETASTCVSKTGRLNLARQLDHWDFKGVINLWLEMSVCPYNVYF